MHDFSKNEVKMFRALGYTDEDFEFYDTFPIHLFDRAKHSAFVMNKQGPAVEALRRAVVAISNCNPYRHTPEFEKLIEFK